MSKVSSKKFNFLVLFLVVVIAIILGFLFVKADPDAIIDSFTDESKIDEGTEKVLIDTASGTVKLAPCYYTNGTWQKIADTVVRDISTSSASATVNKDIYCDDSNCVLWTDEGGTPPNPLCVATDPNVYGNILWSRANEPSTYTYGPETPLSGDQIGGIEPSGYYAGANSRSIGGKTWLSRYYVTGGFPAMNACRSKGPGWRLPTALELDSIRDMTVTPKSRLPGIIESAYWSATEYSNMEAFYLDFFSGYFDSARKSLYPLYVRCVRDY
jgi:hypothetical protein